MRNIGLAFILVLIGMLIWKAAEQERPVQPAHLASAATDSQLEPEDPDAPPSRSSMGLSFRALPAEKFNLQNHQLVQPPQIHEGEDTPSFEKSPISSEQNHLAIEQEPVTSKRVFERIAIPSIKVNTKIVVKPYSELTWDLSTLGHDVAALEEIPNQTTDNNLVFAGHVTVRNGSHGPFRYLFRLVPGDLVLLEDENYIYTYAVRDQILVYPEESFVLNDSPHMQLTLITCTTYDEETETYLRRRVIFADFVKVELKEVLLD